MPGLKIKTACRSFFFFLKKKNCVLVRAGIEEQGVIDNICGALSGVCMYNGTVVFFVFLVPSV